MFENIVLRNYICSPTGKFECNDVKVNLYIYASEFCPASCSFCPGFLQKIDFNFLKFKEAFKELYDKDFINRISITGGESLYNLEVLNGILKIIYEVSGNHYDVSISTNGFNLFKLKNIECFSVLNDIHVSRHSEDDEENSKIFGIKTPTLIQIQKEIKNNPNKYSFSCNLMKGFVDSSEKVKLYLNRAIDIGVRQVGFVSLMNKTKKCSELFLDFEDITSNLYVCDGFLFEKNLKNTDLCKCENYTYYNDFGSMPIYFRRVIKKSDKYFVGVFVFRNNEIITGF